MHEFDALDLAQIWPCGSQPTFAPLEATEVHHSWASAIWKAVAWARLKSGSVIS